jgi:hypothetical protein
MINVNNRKDKKYVNDCVVESMTMKMVLENWLIKKFKYLAYLLSQIDAYTSSLVSIEIEYQNDFKKIKKRQNFNDRNHQINDK